MNTRFNSSRKNEQHDSRFLSILHGRRVAWSILGISLSLTLLAGHLTNRHIATRHQERFRFSTDQMIKLIEERMLEYELALRGGVALHEASQNVSREEWHDYIEHCEIERHFPGIQGLGVAVRLQEHEITAHESSIRDEGFPEYRVFPTEPRDNYTSIIYLEPFDWRNQRAFGYDMYSEPTRRHAMQRAVDTGDPAITNRIKLVQETESDVQAGVLCYLPMYAKNVPLDSIEDRRAASIGWVYAAFRCDDLMTGIVGELPNEISFQIFDSATTDPKSLLFDSSDGANSESTQPVNDLVARRNAEVAGRTWTILFAANSGFVQAEDTWLSVMVAAGGLLIDLLLFAVIYFIGRQKEFALHLASKMTRDLRESETQTRSILENASEAVLSVSAFGEILWNNPASRQMFRGGEDLARQNFNDLLVDMPLRDLISKSAVLEKNAAGISTICRGKDVSEFPCRMSLGHLELDGEVSYIVIARDETARVKSEKKIAEINRRLVDSSHKAGMAEVATGVLHNVGNALNSVTTSAGVIAASIAASPVPRLIRASEILSENKDNLPDFLEHHPQGKFFCDYIVSVSSALDDQRQCLDSENQRLQDHIHHIREIVRTQQDQACGVLILQNESVADLVNQAIDACRGRNQEHNIQVNIDLNPCDAIYSDRHKVQQILHNLITNAQDSVIENPPSRPRVIGVRASMSASGGVEILVTDNGIGIPESDLTKVLQFGFTTKQDGHGFGLHSCVIAAQSLGGNIEVASDGLDCGARFTLKLPLNQDACNPLPVTLNLQETANQVVGVPLNQ